MLGYFQPSLRDCSRYTFMAGLFSAKCCLNQPTEKANLDKTDFQSSLRGLVLLGTVPSTAWRRPQLPVPARTCSAIRRIAWMLRSTSSEEVAQEDTLIRMARRPFQIVPPHQHVPSS